MHTEKKTANDFCFFINKDRRASMNIISQTSGGFHCKIIQIVENAIFFEQKVTLTRVKRDIIEPSKNKFFTMFPSVYKRRYVIFIFKCTQKMGEGIKPTQIAYVSNRCIGLDKQCSCIFKL